MTQAKDAAGNLLQAMPAIQPLWPMLFVTIACGAISGWHSLVGSIGTARQLEYETDALPVGGGGMFTENALALLALVAVSIAGGAGAGAFASEWASCWDSSPSVGSIHPTEPPSASACSW